MVTDVAGFAAAVYHRGVPVVHVATTLLGQVDAAIGGKTGVNLPEGKNLVGAFWQPTAVLCDIDALGTLPAAGVPQRPAARWPSTTSSTRRRPRPTCRSTSAVAALRRASRPRWWPPTSARGRPAGALLNYGHTLGPRPRDRPADYDLRHGEAVAIGLVFAAELARALGRIDDDRVAEHRAVVGGLRPARPRCPPASTPTSWSTLMAPRQEGASTA